MERAVIYEPMRGPWLGDQQAQWGNKWQDRLPAAAGQVFSIAELPSTPGPPRVYTVQLTRNTVPSDGDNADVYAQIEYGTGAMRETVLVDWTQGAHVSLVANAIRVNAFSYAPRAISAYAAGTGVVSLAVAFGAGVGKGGRITRTEPTARINGGGNVQDYQIPDFARAVTVRLLTTAAPGNDPAIATQLSIRQQNGAVVDLTLNDCQIFAGGTRWQGLAGGARSVRLTNNSGGTIDCNLQWELSL